MFRNRYIEFTPGFHHPALNVTKFYGDREFVLHISIGWGNLFISLPFLKSDSFDDLSYGFYLYKEGRGVFDSISFCWGKHHKTINMPWCFVFYRMATKTAGDGWFVTSDDDRKFARSLGGKRWNIQAYELPDSVFEITNFPITYKKSNGEVQNAFASCMVEVREWRRKMFRHTGWFNMVRKDVNISVVDENGKVAELGNRSGGWKGGTTGFSAELREGDTVEEAVNRKLREEEIKGNW